MLASSRKELEEGQELLERGRREAAEEADKLDLRREVGLAYSWPQCCAIDYANDTDTIYSAFFDQRGVQSLDQYLQGHCIPAYLTIFPVECPVSCPSVATTTVPLKRLVLSAGRCAFQRAFRVVALQRAKDRRVAMSCRIPTSRSRP